MSVVPLGKLTDGLIDQCMTEVHDKFPDLSSLSNEPADMDKFFDHEISTVGDVDAAVRGTPFASPWKNIPHFAKWRCIGFFKICKFLRKNSNDPKKVVGALRDIFSEHVGLDFDERMVNDLTRLFDDSSAAKSRASPKVEKLLGFLSNIIGTHDEAERRFRDEPISVTGFVPGAATVSASNDDYIVVTQGLYLDVYRKSSGYPLVFSESIDFGRENTISNSINDPAVAISDNGKYIAVGVPGSTDNGDLSDGRIHVYKKEFDDRWTHVFYREDNRPGYGCRGSIDVNDHGFIAFTHGDRPGLSDERGYVCVLDPARRNTPLLYTSGAGAQRLVEKKYVYGEYDDDELALIKNKLEGFGFQHRFGRHIKFIDSTARDWKIRIGSGVDASDLPKIDIHRKGDLVLKLGERRSLEVTGINDDGVIKYMWEDPQFVMYDRNIVFDDSLPSSGNVTVYRGEFGWEQSIRSLSVVPLYYEFGDGKCIHNSAFYETVEEYLEYEGSEINDWKRANPGMIIEEDKPYHHHGEGITGYFTITFIPTLRPSNGSIVLEKGNELTLSTGRSQHINDDTHPFICSDGQIVRYCDVNFDVNSDTPPDKFLMVYDDDSGTQHSTRIDQPPISVDSVGHNVTDIMYLTTKSYGGNKLPPGLESGAKTFIVLGENEHLIGRQILFSYEKRWKLRWWILALGIVLFSAGPGGVAALVSWGLMSWLTSWNPVLEGLLSAAIFVGSTLFLAAVNTGGSTLLRELLDMWIDDEKFFGKDRRTMLALDRDALVTRGSSNVVENMLKKFFAKGLEDFGDGVDEFAKKVKDDLEDKTDDIKDVFGKFGDGVDEFFENVKDDLEDKTDDIKDAFGKFGDGVDEFAKKVKDDLEDKKDDIKDAFGKFGNNGKKDRTPLIKKRIEKRR